MMQSQILGLAAVCCLFVAVSAQECDFAQLLDDLKSNKLSLAQYTKSYTECIAGKGAKPSPAVTTGGFKPGSQSQFGFQPACSNDNAVTMALVKFSNQGTFKAADEQTYPFHVRGVVTLTQVDEGHTRIQATISGLSAFTFDSDQFSLHVHQKGEINPTCSSTGGHYNPCGVDTHSDNPAVADRHVGDVAKVTIPQGQDVITIDVTDTQVKLTGPLSVLGRSVTVHAGSGGTRVGCGTIAVTEWQGDFADLTYDAQNPFWSS